VKPSVSQIRTQWEASRLQFVQTELNISLTFMTLAREDAASGNIENLERNRNNAQKGHDTAVYFLLDATGLTEKDQREISSKLTELRAQLEDLPK
jgi:hypothetical protein